MTDYPLRLKLIFILSWFDFHLTGVPWHQRRYARNAWLEFAPTDRIDPDRLLRRISREWEMQQ